MRSPILILALLASTTLGADRQIRIAGERTMCFQRGLAERLAQGKAKNRAYAKCSELGMRLGGNLGRGTTGQMSCTPCKEKGSFRCEVKTKEFLCTDGGPSARAAPRKQPIREPEEASRSRGSGTAQPVREGSGPEASASAGDSRPEAPRKLRSLSGRWVILETSSPTRTSRSQVSLRSNGTGTYFLDGKEYRMTWRFQGDELVVEVYGRIELAVRYRLKQTGPEEFSGISSPMRRGQVLARNKAVLRAR